MATTTISGQSQVISSDELTGFKRYFVRRFHPRSIFIDSVAFIWFTYFFWNHDWKNAILAVVAGRVAAVFAVRNIDVVAFSKTMLGKIGLLHLHSMNLITQSLGAVILLYGIWMHSAEIILGGTSLIFLGHLAGWSKVDSRF